MLLEIRYLAGIESPIHIGAHAYPAFGAATVDLELLPFVVGSVDHEGQVLAAGDRLDLHRRGASRSLHRKVVALAWTLYGAINEIFLAC